MYRRRKINRYLPPGENRLGKDVLFDLTVGQLTLFAIVVEYNSVNVKELAGFTLCSEQKINSDLQYLINNNFLVKRCSAYYSVFYIPTEFGMAVFKDTVNSISYMKESD